MNKEIRSFNIASTNDGRKVGGYAIVWNSLSVDLGGFREIISPTAVTEDLINNSDIIFNYNHDNNYMLGRSRNGEGTLSLRIDDNGLYFECDLPNSPMGDNIKESIKRGDLSQCSFAFSIDPNDETAETWEEKEDGIYRTINHIDGLYDVSAVNFPAYEETSISERAKILLRDMNKEEIILRAEEEEEVKDPEEQEQKEETPDEQDPKEEETKSEDDKDECREDDPEEDETDAEDPEEEKSDDEEESEEERNIKIHNIESTTMEKRFSLLKAITDVAKGRQLTGAEAAVSERGKQVMADAGQEFSGQIQLPIAEMRDDTPVHYTVNADGEHVVVTDYLNILEPLRAKNVLVQAGAHYETGLKGDLQLPIASDVNVYFEDEIADAQNGAGSFSSVKFAPRRMTAEIPISKMFLVQDTLGAENMIRDLLVTKINNKLESVILSEAAASGAKPAGIFYNVSPTEVSDFAGICELESDIADNNIDGPLKYIVSPKAKAALRSMIKGTNATGMVMEYDEVDGKPAYETTHMTTNKFAVGDWSCLYVCQWGGIDLTVDPYTWSGKGMIRLVVNAFFDYKVVRDGAIVYGEISQD